MKECPNIIVIYFSFCVLTNANNIFHLLTLLNLPTLIPRSVYDPDKYEGFHSYVCILRENLNAQIYTTTTHSTYT